jgi:hypothetical protein
MSSWPDHFEGIEKILNSKHDISNNIEHSLTKGQERELFIDEFLSELFPQKYVFTNGEVVDCEGKTSKEADIIIYDERFPQFNYEDAAHLLAEGVLLHIEVKSDIRNGDLEDGFKKSNSVKQMSQYEYSELDGIPERFIDKIDLEQTQRLSSSIVSYKGHTSSRVLRHTVNYALKENFNYTSDAKEVGKDTVVVDKSAIDYLLPEFICVIGEYLIEINEQERFGNMIYEFTKYDDGPLSTYVGGIFNEIQRNTLSPPVVGHYTDM